MQQKEWKYPKEILQACRQSNIYPNHCFDLATLYHVIRRVKISNGNLFSLNLATLTITFLLIIQPTYMILKWSKYMTEFCSLKMLNMENAWINGFKLIGCASLMETKLTMFDHWWTGVYQGCIDMMVIGLCKPLTTLVAWLPQVSRQGSAVLRNFPLLHPRFQAPPDNHQHLLEGWGSCKWKQTNKCDSSNIKWKINLLAV